MKGNLYMLLEVTGAELDAERIAEVNAQMQAEFPELQMSLGIPSAAERRAWEAGNDVECEL